MSVRKASPASILPVRVEAAACAQTSGCQYASSRERADGRCAWHGQLADYEATRDRTVLFNRGLCGEDEVGPRMGQLCSVGRHHEECLVGVRLLERARRVAESARKPSAHDVAMGNRGDGA